MHVCACAVCVYSLQMGEFESVCIIFVSVHKVFCDPVKANLFVFFFFFLFPLPAGLSSPPANITTSAVPSIVTPIVNGFTGIPHQPNGHPAVETVYTNGLPAYSTQSPTAADTLQQAFTGVQQYTGVTRASSVPHFSGFTACRKH